MDSKRLDYFKHKLLEEKEELIKTKDGISKSAHDSMEIYSNELSGYDNHPGDAGTELYMQEQDEGFKENIRNKLDEIEKSLDMIEDGSYGKCENCNKDIMEERLELIPYVKTCLDCLESEDKDVDYRQFESIDDEYATKPSNDPDNNVGYDREDAYQDVAADNIVDKDPSMSTGDNIGLARDYERDGVEAIESISEEDYEDSKE